MILDGLIVSACVLAGIATLAGIAVILRRDDNRPLEIHHEEYGWPARRRPSYRPAPIPGYRPDPPILSDWRAPWWHQENSAPAPAAPAAAELTDWTRLTGLALRLAAERRTAEQQARIRVPGDADMPITAPKEWHHELERQP